MNIETIRSDMVKAMKAHDKLRKDTLSALVSAVKKLAIDEGVRDDIPDELTDRAILKELKTAKEQVDTCPDDRTDLKEEYTQRYEIIGEYAPKMLSEEEIEQILKDKFADELASGNKGQIMKAVMPELKGKADGKLIGQVVEKLLG